MDPNLEDFLMESNAIEGVRDDASLSRAGQAWNFLIQKDQLTVQDILDAHKILAPKGLKKSLCGKFRKIPVYIRTRAHPLTQWSLVPRYMTEWVKRLNLHDVNDKEMHIEFENIHPFVDGNGRMGRLLMNWQRLKAGKSLLVIKADDRFQYYAWFQT